MNFNGNLEFECEFEWEFEQEFEWEFFQWSKNIEQEKVRGFYSTILTPMKLSINRLTNLDSSFCLA